MHSNKVQKRLSTIAMLVVLLAIVGFLVWRQWASRNQTPPAAQTDSATVPSSPLDVSFRLKWVFYSSFAHHFVAKEKGFFEKEGLDVEIHPGGAGIDPIKLVASNVDDVGLASYAQILLARAKGVPVIAIGEEYVTSGVVAISLQTSGITKPTDFIGKKVGIIPGSDTGTVYEALMAKQGIDRSQIEEVPIGFDLSVLFTGTVDVSTVAYITNQPVFAEQNGYPVNIIDPSHYGVNPGGNVFFTSEETLRSKRDLLRRFLRGALTGIMRSRELDDSNVVDIVLQYNDKLNREAELKIWDATKRVLLTDDAQRVGVMPKATWEETARLFHDFGSLEIVPALDECYTNSLVEEVLKEGLQ